MTPRQMVVLRLSGWQKEIEGLRSFQAMQIPGTIFSPDNGVETVGRDIYPEHEVFQVLSSVLLLEA